MRIVYYADNFYPELSGIVDSILTTGAELHARGHEIAFVGPHYLTRHYTMVGRQYTEVNGHESIDNMRVVRLPSLPMFYSPTNQSRMAFPSGKSLAFLKEFKPDIIHTQSPYGCGIEALRAAKRLRIPLVGTNHTAIEEFFPFAPKTMRKYDAWYYNHCSSITAPFSKLIEHMREVGFHQPGQALPNPVVRTRFNPPAPGEKERIKAQFGLVGPVILQTGRVAIEKRLDVVMHAIAKIKPQFPTICFVITGHGPALGSLQALAQELHLGDNIIFTGFVSSDVLGQYYKAADIFTIMSTADSQSIALMQAYATGIPAIGANSRGLPDYIPKECGFLLEPFDVEGLADHLSLLLHDEPLRHQMGAAGIQFIEKMSPECIAGGWEQIYTEAIARHA